MIASSLLESEELLRPIPGFDPAGDSRAYAHRLHDLLDELRREDHPEDYDESTRPAELKRADWAGVVAVSEQALLEETKDLRVACHLVEARVHLAGLPGLREGLELIHDLCAHCWERLNPPLDDDDLETRAAPLSNMLDDPIRGLCFPNLIRDIPILGGDGQPCSLLQWRKSQAKGDADAERWRADVLSDSSLERLQQKIEEAEACLEAVRALRVCLQERLGEHAPGFQHLEEAIEECQRLTRQAALELAPTAVSTETTTGLHQSDEPRREHGAPAPELDAFVQLRDSAYRQIEIAAATLCQLEPHSPAPYLIMRAVELGRQPFPRMIRQFVREEQTLSEMYRELGIEPAKEAPSQD